MRQDFQLLINIKNGRKATSFMVFSNVFDFYECAKVKHYMPRMHVSIWIERRNQICIILLHSVDMPSVIKC